MTAPHWMTSNAPNRTFAIWALLLIFAPWVEDRYLSLWERLFFCGLIWFIVIFQMALPIWMVTR